MGFNSGFKGLIFLNRTSQQEEAVATTSGSLVTTAWRFLRLRMEEMISSYKG